MPHPAKRSFSFSEQPHQDQHHESSEAFARPISYQIAKLLVEELSAILAEFDIDVEIRGEAV
jgi:hypothetical protein